jgi:hypothetical protein
MMAKAGNGNIEASSSDKARDFIVGLMGCMYRVEYYPRTESSFRADETKARNFANPSVAGN